MNKIIKNQLYLLFKKKNVYIFFIIICLILMQIYNVYINQTVENINATYLDSILKIYGGIYKNTSILNIVYWILLIILLFILTENYNGIFYGFDIMLLSRSDSKAQWWISKIITSLIITVIYAFTIIILSKLLSHIVFKSDYLTEYGKIYYPNIDLDMISSIKIQLFLIGIFVTGFLSIITLFQILNLLFNNNVQSYVIFIIISIVLVILYQNNLIPRLLSPLYYPSILNLNTNTDNIFICILANILLTFINIIISTIIVIKKDYSEFIN